MPLEEAHIYMCVVNGMAMRFIGGERGRNTLPSFADGHNIYMTGMFRTYQVRYKETYSSPSCGSRLLVVGAVEALYVHRQKSVS